MSWRSKQYRNLNGRTKVVDVDVERSIFIATKVILVALETRFECGAIVIDQNKFLFVDILVHLQRKKAPTLQILSRMAGKSENKQSP